MADLHGLMLRVAAHQVWRMSSQLAGLDRQTIEVLINQSADEATIASLLVDTRPWLSCDDCFRMLDTFTESLVHDTGQEDPAMVTHLVGCAACREEADSLVSLLRDDELHPGRHRAEGGQIRIVPLGGGRHRSEEGRAR